MYVHQKESESEEKLVQAVSKAGAQRENQNPEFQHELQLKEKAQKRNDTGLPDHLKLGIENLSGHSMDDVKVHYNSSKPAQLNAHAYAQGNQIHLGGGQEKHLAHEAWHVVQQKQGRVKPTVNVNGAKVNDDFGLEKEADEMGGKAIQRKSYRFEKNQSSQNGKLKVSNVNTIQRVADPNMNLDWLEGRPIAAELVDGINGGQAPGIVLNSLLNNFSALGGRFNYTMARTSGEDFLGGVLNGDCRTLSHAFQLIGENFFGIEGFASGHANIHLSNAPNTPYGGHNRNCNEGACWLFQEHYWAVHGGVVYDLLFGVINPAFVSINGVENNSIAFPDGTYVLLEDGRIVYQLPNRTWVMIPLELSSKIYYILINGGTIVLKGVGRLLIGTIMALSWPIRWIFNKIKDGVLGEEEDPMIAFRERLAERRED